MKFKTENVKAKLQEMADDFVNELFDNLKDVKLKHTRIVGKTIDITVPASLTDMFASCDIHVIDQNNLEYSHRLIIPFEYQFCIITGRADFSMSIPFLDYYNRSPNALCICTGVHFSPNKPKLIADFIIQQDDHPYDILSKLYKDKRRIIPHKTSLMHEVHPNADENGFLFEIYTSANCDYFDLIKCELFLPFSQVKEVSAIHQTPYLRYHDPDVKDITHIEVKTRDNLSVYVSSELGRKMTEELADLLLDWFCNATAPDGLNVFVKCFPEYKHLFKTAVDM